MKLIADNTKFPSFGHLQSLRRKFKEAKFNIEMLTQQERWYYFAYDHGWAAYYGNEWQAELDPHKQWYDPDLVAEAEVFYRKHFHKDKSRAYSPPADDPSLELQAIYREQDDERARLAARIIDERMLDGSYTPEMQAYMECVLRQVRQNTQRFAERSSAAFRDDADMSVEDRIATTVERHRQGIAKALRRLNDPALNAQFAGRNFGYETPEELDASLERLRRSLGVWSKEQEE